MNKWPLFLLLTFAGCGPSRQAIVEPSVKPLVSLQSPVPGTWKPLGPFGSPEPMAKDGELSPHGAGRFMCIDIHPKNEGEMLAGHATAGLFKTTDNGRTWHQKLRLPFATGIFRILRFRNDPGHLIACSALDAGNSRQYGYGLIESFDNGETWQRNSLQFDPEEYNLEQSRDIAVLDRKKETRLLSISDRYLYLSEDGSKTWNKILDPKLSLKTIVVDPNDERSVFVCGNGVLYSSDGGRTWENITNDISRTYGKENSSFTRFQVCFSQTYKNRFYVAAEDGSVYVLQSHTDSMKTWRLINRNACMLNVSRLAFDAGIDGATGIEHLYIGTTRLSRSDDGGAHFEQVTSPAKGLSNTAHDDINAIAFHKGRVYIANDGGIDVSADAGKTWQSLTNGSLNLNASMLFGFDKSRNGSMMCGTQDNGIFTLKNGEWYCSGLYGDGGRAVAINDSTGFATGYAQSNYTTANAGISFEYKHAGNERTGHDYRMAFIRSSNTFYLANMHLYKKKQGKYFEILTSKLNPERKIRAFWVNPSNENEIWLCKDEPTWGEELRNKLFYTDDGGQTWLDYTYRLPMLAWRSMTDIHINKKGHVAITLEAFDKNRQELHKVYISEDGGFTFINRSAGLPNVPANSIICVKDQWICGTNNGVFVLSGGHWEPFGLEFPAAIVTELRYFGEEGLLYASTFGRGIWGIRM